MPSTCAVHDCSSSPEYSFELVQQGSGALPIQAVVCGFHKTALEAGDAYEYDFESRSIRMGTDTSAELISWSAESSWGSPDIVTLKLGHDGIITQEVRVRVTPQFLKFAGVESVSEFVVRGFEGATDGDQEPPTGA